MERAQKALAQAQHLISQLRFAALVEEGLATTTDPAKGIYDPAFLFKNSCEWIRNGGMRIRILSPTHDANDRQTGMVAYFDATVLHPSTGGDYPHELVSDARVMFEEPGTLGLNHPGGTQLDLFDLASRTDEEIKSTLIHEVQHSADQSWPGQRWVDPRGSAYSDYQSELRAYWTETREGASNDHFGSSAEAAVNDTVVSFTDPATGTEQTVTTNFRNKRQEEIFKHLLSGYPYVPRNYVQDPAFKAMADAFDRPVGGNLVNSIRIERVATAVDRCTADMEPADPVVASMLSTCDGLDGDDRAFLGDETASGSFWTVARGRLSPEVFEMLRNKVRYGTIHPLGDYPLPEGDVAYA
jgi:hypothetical protein